MHWNLHLLPCQAQARRQEYRAKHNAGVERLKSINASVGAYFGALISVVYWF